MPDWLFLATSYGAVAINAHSRPLRFPYGVPMLLLGDPYGYALRRKRARRSLPRLA